MLFICCLILSTVRQVSKATESQPYHRKNGFVSTETVSCMLFLTCLNTVCFPDHLFGLPGKPDTSDRETGQFSFRNRLNENLFRTEIKPAASRLSTLAYQQVSQPRLTPFQSWPENQENDFRCRFPSSLKLRKMGDVSFSDCLKSPVYHSFPTMSDQSVLHSPGHPLFFDPEVRRVRSFVTRAGRLSSGQERAIREFGPDFILPFIKETLDYEKLFGRKAKTVFEIGFGMGETTAAIAENRPEVNFIGVEVHTPGVGSLLKLIGEKKLSNIRLIQHDAVEVLEHMIPENSLDGVHIFFPDPWHKARHHKRRLIQSGFIRFLTTRLVADGYLHCATDWQPYAEQMLEVLSAEASLRNTASNYAERPDYRPVTKFEKRGIRLGHGVWDLIFRKRHST